MLAFRELMAAGLSTPSTPPTTWNPSDNGGLTLSNGNLTAVGTGSTYYSVRATNGYSTGKRYFEIRVDATGDSVYGQVGVLGASASLTGAVGDSAVGWAYYQETGEKYHSGVAASYGSAWTTGTVIGCAVDLDAGKIWWSKNGVWIASGNPATGAKPAFTGLSGTLFPATSIYASNGDTVTARFSAADQTYAAPSGFSAWG